jgi:hypothetical protein
MKNKWLVFGTLLGVALGAGIIYFGIKRYKELNKEKPLSRTKLRRLLDK